MNKFYYAIFWNNMDNFRGIYVTNRKYVDSSEICKQWCERTKQTFHYSAFFAYDATEESVNEMDLTIIDSGVY